MQVPLHRMPQRRLNRRQLLAKEVDFGRIDCSLGDAREGAKFRAVQLLQL